LHVVVCGKVIPDSSVTLQIDSATKRMVRTDVPHELDPAAASAVEEALRLTEQHGGSVTFVTMGIPDATIGIRRALAMGATAGVHLLDDAFAGSDTLGTAKALAAAIKQLPAFDLVICGTESSDSYSGIVPVQLAHFLGVPPLTFAKEVTVDGDTATIHRQSETGYVVVKSQMPALISVTSGINEPRYPQLKGIMAARKIEITTFDAGALGLGPSDVGESAARERVLAVGAPPERAGGRIVQDDGNGGVEIANFLAQLGVI
jgi:electron transfer flavoprotein beta subunit